MNQKVTQYLLPLLLAAVLIAAAILHFGGSAPTGIVVLDPGHGGNDSGAVGQGRCEKDDNLAFALSLKEKLEDSGVEVLLTREDDSFVSLEDRCTLANRHRAELFVSLHRNSAENGSGAEVWISRAPSKKESDLARDILDALAEVGNSQNRGVKKGYAGGLGDYYVNSKTKMPSCLVELGFMGNSRDNELFD